MNKKKWCRGAFCSSIALLGIAIAGGVAAQGFPSKPINLVVPNPPGGLVDTSARLVADSLGKVMAHSVVVDNKPGASGNLAYGQVARQAAKDGHTLLVSYSGYHIANPILMDKLPWDLKDLVPVGLVTVATNVVAVHPSVPVNNLKEFIAYAKANPGKLSYASAGNGSISHLATELLKTTAQIDMLHVPYKGGGAASADLLAGNVSLMIETITNAQTLVKTGKVRAIANSGSRRWPTAPDLPTFAEAGVPGYQVDSWTGLFIGAGTPKAIVDRLNSEVAKASRDPGYRQAMTQLGVEATSSTPEAFAAFVRAEMAKWARVVQLTGTKVD
jgi:tripartite-type tricarboxylate transporter receptor subunit TctC